MGMTRNDNKEANFKKKTYFFEVVSYVTSFVRIFFDEQRTILFL